MDAELYQQYLALKDAGKKEQAKMVLDRFIASFQSAEEKEQWVRAFLESGDFGDRIRHEIYEQLVFPVLLKGYHAKDPWSLLWLAKTNLNLISASWLHSQVDSRSPYELLREAYAIAPDEAIRNELLLADLRGYAYCEHEWPAGILYDGGLGATLEQCDDLLQEIEFTRTLDREGRHKLYLDSFEAKVKEYKARLSSRRSGE